MEEIKFSPRLTERGAVYELLMLRSRTGALSGSLYEALYAQHPEFTPEEKGFIKRLTELCIEREAVLNSVLKKRYSDGRPPKARLRILLRMGAAQILWMDAVPDYAACQEIVALLKDYKMAGLTGFANAMLRRIAREKESILAEIADKSHLPGWLRAFWVKAYGAEEAERLVRAMDVLPETCLRYSGAPAQQASWMEAIRAVRSSRDGLYLPECIRLTEPPGDIRDLPGYAEGLFAVMDESSMLAAASLGLAGGETVADLCAAPGGKSLHAARILEDKGGGRVLSLDVSGAKLARVRENAERLGMTRGMEVRQADARKASRVLGESVADAVLCDVPCSGLGVLRRKHEVARRMDEAQIRELVVLQREIVREAVRVLRPGGTLLYSTCTIDPLENQENAAYIRDELGLRPLPVEDYLPRALLARGGLDTGGLGFQLDPARHETDGFYLARFVKA